MVVSRDWQEVSVLECILGSLQMDVAVENAPERALARLNKNKIDALIVDCDLEGTSQFLRELQREHRYPNAVPLVIMGGRHRRKDLQATGALFAFDKPISVEQAVHTLSAARNMILDGRLRYHRAGLEVPVALSCNPHKRVEAQLINLSQGGLQVYSDDLVETSKPLQICFELPGTRCAMKAQAEVAWRDGRGNFGIRFLKVTPRLQRVLQIWLAQQYFAN